MDHISALQAIVGERFAVTGADADKWRTEWTGAYTVNPSVVVRPNTTGEVSEIMAYAHEHELPLFQSQGTQGLLGRPRTMGRSCFLWIA